MSIQTARTLDHLAVRCTLAAIAVAAWVLLGPLIAMGIWFGVTGAPVPLALGLGGLAGLMGASVRLWLGPRTFLIAQCERCAIACCLAIGVLDAIALALLLCAAAPLAALAAALLAALGAFVLDGSIRPRHAPLLAVPPRRDITT